VCHGCGGCGFVFECEDAGEEAGEVGGLRGETWGTRLRDGGFGGERTPGWVEDGIGDGSGGGCGGGGSRGVSAGLAGEGGGGDAQGFEEMVGALDIEVVGGDAGGDLGESEQDGAVVLDDGEGEGLEVVLEFAVGARVGVGAVGLVVVVAEGALAEGGRAALVAGGVDVAAAGAGLGDGFGFGCGGGCGFGGEMGDCFDHDIFPLKMAKSWEYMG
jgi:hypothetical protein